MRPPFPPVQPRNRTVVQARPRVGLTPYGKKAKEKLFLPLSMEATSAATSQRLRELGALVAYLGLSVAMGVLALPWVYAAFHPMFPQPPHRYLHRLILVALVGLFPLFRKKMGARSWPGEFFTLEPGWASEVGFGFFFGILFVAALLAEARSSGLPSPLHIPTVARILSLCVQAWGVALVEESFFRGVIAANLQRTLGTPSGLFGSATLFSLAHYIGHPGKAPWPKEGDVLQAWSACFGPLLDGAWWEPRALILFLAGLVLAAALFRTGRLWLSSGLHAGWVFALRLGEEMAGSTKPACFVLPLEVGTCLGLGICLLLLWLWKSGKSV